MDENGKEKCDCLDFFIVFALFMENDKLLKLAI